MDMPWLKWWDGTATDPKFGMVALECGIPVASVLGIWAYLLEHASRNEIRGSIEGLDYEVMAFALQVPNVETVCNAMKRRSLVTETGEVVSWDKRQAKREKSEPPGASTKRVQALRDRLKAAAGAESNGKEDGNDDATDVTACNGTKRPKKKIKNKSREDKEEGSNNRSQNSISQLAPATRLPDDWVLPKNYGLWAKEYDPGWSDAYIRELGEAFKDYWTALPNNSRAKKTDWFGTWRNFLRQRVKPSAEATNGKGSGVRARFWYSSLEGVMDKLAAEGMEARAGETLQQTVDRILKKLEADAKKGAEPAAPQPAESKLSIPLEPTPAISAEEAGKARQAAMEIISRNKRFNQAGHTAPPPDEGEQ